MQRYFLIDLINIELFHFDIIYIFLFLKVVLSPSDLILKTFDVLVYLFSWILELAINASLIE